jgi:hypothetical protein
MPGPGTILELVPSARTGRSHSTGERPLTSDERHSVRRRPMFRRTIRLQSHVLRAAAKPPDSAKRFRHEAVSPGIAAWDLTGNTRLPPGGAYNGSSV